VARVDFGIEALKAAERWRDKCLRGDGSVFSSKTLWTSKNVDQLDRYFVRNLDYGEGDFFGKLEAQLQPASAEAKQLAAEMFWVMYLFVSEKGMRAGTKRLQIKRVWEWSGESLPEVPELRAPLEKGIGRTGTAYNTHRWRELAFFIGLMQGWKGLTTANRESLLADPWEFADWVDGLDRSKGRQLRHILLHLLFPDTFERMATAHHKRMILRSFVGDAGVPVPEIKSLPRIELDRALLRVRARLERDQPARPLDFYQPDLKKQWLKVKEPAPDVYLPDADPEGRGDAAWARKQFGTARVWLIAAGTQAEAWDSFRTEGTVAIGWDFLGDLTEFESKEDITEAIRLQMEGTRDPFVSGLACWQFANEMQVGDWVIAKQGRRRLLGYGRIRSDYRFDSGRTAFQHVRDVEWVKSGSWPLADDRQLTPKTVTDFTANTPWLRYAFALMDTGEGESNGEWQPYGIGDALTELFMPQGVLEGVLGALRRKSNLVLEGPPGVGKTFAAKRIAWALMGRKDADRVELIQFHQSYAYEDFIQGWRPTGDGQFALRAGVFLRFCSRAAADPSHPYVLIIDEINRGNLSKVFGELLMLIEGDKRGPESKMQLTYSQDGDEPFYVPKNLYIIGCMNTADRSLAMVDYALRRRFSFVKLRPAFAREEFQNFLLDAGAPEEVVDRVVKRMTDLNETIRNDRKNLGEGFEIGHSYFCPTDADEDLDEAWYERVIRLEIEPLLNEYWVDQPEKAAAAVADLLQ